MSSQGFAIADTPKRIDGDDYTWDWWQTLGDAGHFTVADDGIGVTYVPLQYDTRTGPDKLSNDTSARFYALECQLVKLQQRLAAVEAELNEWRGD